MKMDDLFGQPIVRSTIRRKNCISGIVESNEATDYLV